jgi:hypothetical protein
MKTYYMKNQIATLLLVNNRLLIILYLQFPPKLLRELTHHLVKILILKKILKKRQAEVREYLGSGNISERMKLIVLTFAVCASKQNVFIYFLYYILPFLHSKTYDSKNARCSTSTMLRHLTVKTHRLRKDSNITISQRKIVVK